MYAHTPRNTIINPISNVVDVVLFYTLRNADINRVSFYIMAGDNTREERLKALKRYSHKKFYRQGNLDKHVEEHGFGFDCYQCDDGDAPQPHP